MTIWALHGFLGLPSDFDALKNLCLQAEPNLNWKSVDYLRLRELSPNQTLQEWGDQFCKFVQKNSAPGEEHILLGYSQGGRLALHALQSNPQPWKSCILLSTNPGISEGEKADRLKNDLQWSQHFLNENFQWVLQKWNSQSVFQGSLAEPVRTETDFNRRQLADCLIQWSVAKQENKFEFLSRIQVPVLYVSGEKDTKYGRIGNLLSQANSRIQAVRLPDSGHRVLFDQPGLLAGVVSLFLGSTRQ